MKMLKSNFNSKNHLRAERKGRQERGGNPTYITMACPQRSHSTLLLLQRPWKTPAQESLARRYPELISHSVLSALFCFITHQVLPAGIFAVLANMMMVSNLMFPKFLQRC